MREETNAKSMPPVPERYRGLRIVSDYCFVGEGAPSPYDPHRYAASRFLSLAFGINPRFKHF